MPRLAETSGEGPTTLSRLCRLVLGLRLTVLAVGALSVTDPWLLASLAGWGVASVALLLGWSRDDRPFLTRPVGLGIDLAGLFVVLVAAGHDTALVAAGYSASLLAGLVLRWRGALAGVAVITLAILLSFRLPLPGTDVTVGLVQEIALVAAFAAVGALLRHTLDVQGETARRHLLSRAAASAAAEREELGRRLHDDLAKDLVGVQLLAEELRDAARDGDEEVGDLAGRVAGAACEAVVASRRLVRRQRSGVRVASVAELLSRATDQALADSDLPVERAIDPAVEVSVSAAGALEAVLREALDNVRQHARAGRVAVRLFADPGATVLEVRDDGVGFPRSARLSDLVGRGSFGVLGMQERMAAVAGRLEILAAPGGGTLVRAVVPRSGTAGNRETAVTREEVSPCGSSWLTTTRSYERAS